MRIPMLPLRPIVYLAVAGSLLGGTIDAGSVMLTRLAVPDDVRTAGHAAAAAAENKPANRQTAQLAFAAAQAEARGYGIVVSVKDFTLFPDGRVTLTAGRTAPTLLLDRIEPLRHYTEVTATETVSALPFS